MIESEACILKILFIGHEADLQGASRSMLNVIDELINNGHKIYVLLPYSSGNVLENIKQRKIKALIFPYEQWEVPWVCTKIERKQLKCWRKNQLSYILKRKKRTIHSANRIAKYIVNEQIDIIHSNTSVINIGALISKYSGIPHVWHIREFGNLDFNMHFYEPMWYVSRFMNKYTDRFICISKAIMEHYAYLDSNKKVLIYNGISNEAIIKKDEKIPHNGIHILITGRISETKGQHEAVAACELLLKHGIIDFELFVAGSGKVYFEISDELKEKVHFLGQVDNMPDVRNHIDIELICSKSEAFGRVTAEAMLAGIPVIGSNTGGTPELINDGVDGFLYDRGNIEMLANKIEILIKDKYLLKNFGRNAQKKAKKMFTIQRCVDEIENVYKDVVSSK